MVYISLFQSIQRHHAWNKYIKCDLHYVYIECTLRYILSKLLPKYNFIHDSTEVTIANNKKKDNAIVYIHGIRPPLDVPVQDLCDIAMHCDLFLYISVVVNDSKNSE